MCVGKAKTDALFYFRWDCAHHIPQQEKKCTVRPIKTNRITLLGLVKVQAGPQKNKDFSISHYPGPLKKKKWKSFDPCFWLC